MIELDIEGLSRLDTLSRVEAMAKAIGSSGFSPNEARKRFLGMGPTPGGESPLAQQQLWTL